MSKRNLTPNELVVALDQHIIGQKDAKRQLAIAERNRWRRMKTAQNIQKEIIPSNILMIGPTGSGKTECARRFARITKAPFVKVEATKFTERGYVGGKVDSMISSLLENALTLVRKEKEDSIKSEVDKRVESIILDLLVPLPPTSSNHEHSIEGGLEMSEDRLRDETRERFRKKLQKGELDQYEIEITIKKKKPKLAGVGLMDGIDESMMMQVQNMLHSIMPKDSEKKKITIKKATPLLREQVAQSLLSSEEIEEEALIRTEKEGIIFIDEIDKIAGKSQQSSAPDVSRQGVQRDLLPILEGSQVMTKYGAVNTDYILFIAAGAFHISDPSDFIPELQGRFPIRVKLKALSQEDFYAILISPNASLIKQYKALFLSEKVNLSFSDDSVREIARFAYEANQLMENIGARRLHTVMSQLLNSFLFDTPEKIEEGSEVKIEKEFVVEKLSSLVKAKNQRRYIL